MLFLTQKTCAVLLLAIASCASALNTTPGLQSEAQKMTKLVGSLPHSDIKHYAKSAAILASASPLDGSALAYLLNGLKKAIQVSKTPQAFSELSAVGQSMSSQLAAATGGEPDKSYESTDDLPSTPYAEDTDSILPKSGTAPVKTASNTSKSTGKTDDDEDTMPTPPQLKIDVESISALLSVVTPLDPKVKEAGEKIKALVSQPSLSQIEFSTAFQDFIVALGATTGPEYGPAKAAMEKIIATSAKPTASASPSSSSAPTQSKVTDPDVAANDENVKDTDISSSSQKLVGSVGVVFLASLFFL